MLTIKNILDKFRSISVDSINDFLTRNGIKHKCVELNIIEFELKGWNWDLYIGDDYVKLDLVFSMSEVKGEDGYCDRNSVEEANLDVTKRVKVLKAFCTSHKCVDKDNGDRVVNRNNIHFSFESFIYNMYDFRELFYRGVGVILGGCNEHKKVYSEFEAKRPQTPIGFCNYDEDSTNEKLQTTNRRRVGYV